MLISILIPVYNVGKFIERCVRSLIEQEDLDDVEIIFVDDASPDNSIAILEHILNSHPILNEKSRIIKHEINKGLSAARNTGIENAKGDYILFLDSDDTFARNGLSILKKAIKTKTPDIVVFGLSQIYPDKKIVKTKNNIVNPYKNGYITDVLMRRCAVTVCGKLYSRKLFMNDFKFIEGLNYGEDYVSLPRIIYYADNILDLTDVVLYHYYKDNSNSYTSEALNEKKIRDILESIKILSDFFAIHRLPEFEDITDELKVRNKIFLLEYCKKSMRKEIIKLFPELNSKKINLHLKHKITWELAQFKSLKLLNLYLDFGNKIKSLLHI